MKTVEFKEFAKALRMHIFNLLDGQIQAFVADVDKDEMWNLYLDSFPEGTNEVYRVRREYDCTCCRRFIRDVGALVVIKDGVRHSIWGLDAPGQFAPVAKALNKYVNARKICDALLLPSLEVGTARTLEKLEGKETTVWNHFTATLTDVCVHTDAKTLGAKLNDIRTTRQVFGRGLDEITPKSLEIVRELIEQGSLYKGDERKADILKFAALQKKYLKLDTRERKLFTWASDAPASVKTLRNHAIGTLLVNLSEDMDVDEAVRKYEAIVAPDNYKRPKAIFTKKMLEDAQATVEKLGLTSALGRRFAVLDDIRVPDTLFVDRDARGRMADGDVFGAMAKDAAGSPKAFGKAEEVPLERFLKEVLPGATKLEVLFENKHRGNCVSLIAPKDKLASSLFKWSNGFSWAYAGNIADSMKERVKAAGGAVDGVLRFSIQWNDLGDHNSSDYDAHCILPNGASIYYGCTVDYRTLGELDVDIRFPLKGHPAVENITWPILNKMAHGKYAFRVHNFARRGDSTSGFCAEVEFDGEVHQFEVRRDIRNHEFVDVATVTLDKSGFSIESDLSSKEPQGKDVWALRTGQFHRVQFITRSPNHWDGEPGIGNKHLFFMLAGMQNPDSPNGFYNEFLRPELDKHKRVFEALGARMRVEPDDNQLSGLGFSSTKRDTLVCRVTGHTTRVIKIAL